MCKIEPQIDKNFCFKVGGYSIKEVQDSLAYYNKNAKDRNEWVFHDKDTLLFVDTNVILNLYEISEQERNEILSFLNANTERVFIPFQVQREYMRRRIHQIQKKLAKLENLMLETKNDMNILWNNIVNIEGTVNGKMNQGVIKYGMPTTYKAFCELKQLMTDKIFNEEIHDKFTQITENIKQAIEKEANEAKSKSQYVYDDPILESLSKLTVLQPLSTEEEDFIFEQYKVLKENYDRIDQKENIKEVFTFPGSGDDAKLVDRDIEKSVAWADFYIYHEVLKQVKSLQKNALFLTREKSKGDWMQRDTCLPFPHYITNAFVMTGKMIYILNAERFMAPSFTKEIKSLDNEVEELIELNNYQSGIGDLDTPEIQNLETPAPISPSASTITTEQNFSAEQDAVDEATLIKNARKTKHWRDISEDEFLNNLKFSVQWSIDFGGGYVGESYFIYDILGNKYAFDHEKCKAMLEKLITDKKVYRDSRTEGEYTFSTLKLLN